MTQRTLRSWRLVTAFSVGLTSASGAQVHRSRIPTPNQVKAEYLLEAGKVIAEMTTVWKTAVGAENVETLVQLFVDEGGHYSGPDGVSHYGREAIREALVARLARVGAVALTRVDFSASGSLAYQFGRYFYGPGPDGPADQGTYVLIMHQIGRGWRVRSYVERTPGR